MQFDLHIIPEQLKMEESNLWVIFKSLEMLMGAVFQGLSSLNTL